MNNAGILLSQAGPCLRLILLLGIDLGTFPGASVLNEGNEATHQVCQDRVQILGTC